MNILVLNGSPRAKGNTKQMIEAFRAGAVSARHEVNVVDVCHSLDRPARSDFAQLGFVEGGFDYGNSIFNI